MQKGVYPVYLFSKYGERLYLGFCQASENNNKKTLRENAKKIRSTIDVGSFDTDNDNIDLERADYVDSTIAFKAYNRGKLPSEKELINDLNEVMRMYRQYLDKLPDRKDEDVNGDSGQDSGKHIIGYNKIFYGVPGSGKSYKVKEEVIKKELGIEDGCVIRITFYPDYSNSDFIGQIMPIDEGDSVKYRFVPGPFAEALKKAYEVGKSKPVALVIEELNRGNAAAIFGDTFQLLDRDEKGYSAYPIHNSALSKYLGNPDEIRIPNNLFIIATMNTSDQGVFVLDTAFTRRWLFEYVRNEFADDFVMKDYVLPRMKGLSWEEFLNAVNRFIVTRPISSNSEDKQIGVYFLENLTGYTEEEAAKRFANKVLRYLWSDVYKYKHDAMFDGNIKSFEALFDEYMDGKNIFTNELNALIDEAVLKRKNV